MAYFHIGSFGVFALGAAVKYLTCNKGLSHRCYLPGLQPGSAPLVEMAYFNIFSFGVFALGAAVKYSNVE